MRSDRWLLCSGSGQSRFMPDGQDWAISSHSPTAASWKLISHVFPCLFAVLHGGL